MSNAKADMVMFYLVQDKICQTKGRMDEAKDLELR